ncbi:MAG: hypothetical protein QXL01_01035 [Thermoplasmatales archaeon]
MLAHDIVFVPVLIARDLFEERMISQPNIDFPRFKDYGLIRN